MAVVNGLAHLHWILPPFSGLSGLTYSEGGIGFGPGQTGCLRKRPSSVKHVGSR